MGRRGCCVLLAPPRIGTRTFLVEDAELIRRELGAVDGEQGIVLSPPAEHVVEMHLNAAVGQLTAAEQAKPRPGLHCVFGSDAKESLGRGGANPGGIVAHEELVNSAYPFSQGGLIELSWRRRTQQGLEIAKRGRGRLECAHARTLAQTIKTINAE